MIAKRQFGIRVSFMEIYNETITDLLNINSKNMQIRDGGVGTTRVTNLTESPCVNNRLYNELSLWIQNFIDFLYKMAE